MKSAIYCRVSTEDQEKEGTSLESQLEACLKKAEELNYETPSTSLFKETFSGLTLERPSLSALRQQAKDGLFNAVIVYSPDRLSRVGEDILSLVKEFKISGVKLIFVKEQWDDTLQGKMVAFMLGWASEFEAAQIKERTMRGKRTLVSKGILPQGTGAGLYGYKWDKKKKKRYPLDFEAKIVERVFNMIAEGNSRYKVSQTLNELEIPTKQRGKWHPLTIERMITNPAYIGKTYFGRTQRRGKKTEYLAEEEWMELPDTTPAIIEQELFVRANKVLERSKQLRIGRPQNEYLLTGHLKCGYCGHPLIGSCLNHKYRYYHCRAAYPTTVRAAICSAKYVRADQLEDIVWDKVREIIEHPDVVLSQIERRSKNTETKNKQIMKLKKKLDEYDKQEKRLIKFVRYDEMNEETVLAEIEQLKKDREEDKKKFNQLTSGNPILLDTKKLSSQLKKYCNRVKKNMDSLSFKNKRYALDALDVRLIVWNDKVRITANIPLEYTNLKQEYEYTLKKMKRQKAKEVLSLSVS